MDKFKVLRPKLPAPRRNVPALSSAERRAQRRAPPSRDRPGRSPDIDSSLGQHHHPLQPPEADLGSTELEPGDCGCGRRRLNLQECQHSSLRGRLQRKSKEKGRRAVSAGQGQWQQQWWQAQSAGPKRRFLPQGKNPERETPLLQRKRQRETLPSSGVVTTAFCDPSLLWRSRYRLSGRVTLRYGSLRRRPSSICDASPPRAQSSRTRWLHLQKSIVVFLRTFYHPTVLTR